MHILNKIKMSDLCFHLITAENSGVARRGGGRGDKWWHAPQGEGLGGASTHFTPFPCPFFVLTIALFIYLLYFCPKVK